MYKYCSWTWWPPKKKRPTPAFPWVVLHNRGLTVLLQIFSALEIKDNSKFNKGQGQWGSNKGRLATLHTTYCNRRLLSSYQTKTFPLNPLL